MKKKRLRVILWAKIRLMVTDNNIEPFHYHNWGPIEHFAAQRVIKDSIWLARMGCLGLNFFFLDVPRALSQVTKKRNVR